MYIVLSLSFVKIPELGPAPWASQPIRGKGVQHLWAGGQDRGKFYNLVAVIINAKRCTNKKNTYLTILNGIMIISGYILCFFITVKKGVKRLFYLYILKKKYMWLNYWHPC